MLAVIHCIIALYWVHAPPTMPLHAYSTAGHWYGVTASHITAQLQVAALTMGTQYGLLPANISTCSLWLSGAICANITTNHIHLIGWWWSEKIFQYLHTQAFPITCNIAPLMFQKVLSHLSQTCSMPPSSKPWPKAPYFTLFLAMVTSTSVVSAPMGLLPSPEPRPVPPSLPTLSLVGLQGEALHQSIFHTRLRKGGQLINSQLPNTILFYGYIICHTLQWVQVCNCALSSSERRFQFPTFPRIKCRMSESTVQWWLWAASSVLAGLES